MTTIFALNAFKLLSAGCSVLHNTLAGCMGALSISRRAANHEKVTEAEPCLFGFTTQLTAMVLPASPAHSVT